MVKVEQGYELESHVHMEADARHLDAPLLQLNLARELEGLRKLDAGGAGGHRAKTLAKYPDMRLVLIALEAGGRVDTHKAPGRVSIHALEGLLSIRLSDGQKVELRAGGILQIAPNVAHDVQAPERSAMLVTIAWPADAKSSAR